MSHKRDFIQEGRFVLHAARVLPLRCQAVAAAVARLPGHPRQRPPCQYRPPVRRSMPCSSVQNIRMIIEFRAHWQLSLRNCSVQEAYLQDATIPRR